MIRSLLLMMTLTGAMATPQVPNALMIKIAREEGIPLKLLKSVTYVESGFHPWSLNVEGTSHRFASRRQAEAHLAQSLTRGHRSIDIGCAQINWQWHGKNFNSAKDLLSPAVSLRYACRLLKSHRRSSGSWMKAALFYHSRDPQRQQIYRARLVRYLTQGQT